MRKTLLFCKSNIPLRLFIRLIKIEGKFPREKRFWFLSLGGGKSLLPSFFQLKLIGWSTAPFRPESYIVVVAPRPKQLATIACYLLEMQPFHMPIREYKVFAF